MYKHLIIFIIAIPLSASAHTLSGNSGTLTFSTKIPQKCGFKSVGASWTSDMIQFKGETIDKARAATITPYSNIASVTMKYQTSITESTLKLHSSGNKIKPSSIAIKEVDTGTNVLNGEQIAKNLVPIKLYVSVPYYSHELAAGLQKVTATVTLTCSV